MNCFTYVSLSGTSLLQIEITEARCFFFFCLCSVNTSKRKHWSNDVKPQAAAFLFCLYNVFRMNYYGYPSKILSVSCRAPPAARMSGAPRGKCDTPRALGLTTGSRCSVTSVFIAPFPAAPSKLLAWNANNLTRGSRSPYLRRRVYPAEVQLHCMSRRAGRSTGLLDYFHLSFTLCELEPLGLRAVHLELFC